MLRGLTLAFASLLVALPARADCEVLGVATLPELEVYAPGERRQVVSVAQRRVAVRPGRGTVRRDVRVLEPLAFSARTRSPIAWAVPRPASVADEMLYWGPTVEVEDAREDPREGLVVRARVDDGVWVSRIHVPCDAVRIGPGEGAMEAPAWTARRGPRWQPRGESLWLHARPGEGATVRLDAPRGLPTAMLELARRDDWVRLMIRFASGAAVRGWAREQQIEVATIRRPPSDWTPREPVAPRDRCPRAPPARGEQVGRVTLPPETPVHWRPGGPVWATTSASGSFRISAREGEPWVRLLRAPGLRSGGRCRDLVSHAWVRRDALPPTGPRQAPRQAAHRPPPGR